MLWNHTANLFQQEGLTGFDLEPVEIYAMKGKAAPPSSELWEMVITGKAGPDSPPAGRTYTNICPGCGRWDRTSEIDGLYVDRRKWDGSDFSLLEGYDGFVILSERAKDVIIANRLRYCAIYKAEDYPML